MSRSTTFRGAMSAAVLLLALIVAWFATRSADASQGASSAHDHAALARDAGSGASSISLSTEQADRIGVTYAVASMQPLSSEIRTVGRVTFDERLVQTIAPKIDGWVEALHVSFVGQQVVRGQPLLAIYSPMLVQAQEELLLARRLRDDVAGGTAEARASAESMLASSRRRLAYWDVSAREIAEIERSGQVRRTITLHSPATGHVLEKQVLSGQKIMAGEPLFRVADLRRVWIEGELFEQDLATVRLGQTVHADMQALPGEHYMGRITYVYPTLDPETRTARVRMELANADLRLKPGMYATMRVESGRRAAVLTVPRSAVLVTGERSLVFVRGADGRLTPRPVRLGAAGTERIEIHSGLLEGETIVASATFLIDAESNLGGALGAMGAVAAPSGGPGMQSPASSPASGAAGAHDAHPR